MNFSGGFGSNLGVSPTSGSGNANNNNDLDVPLTGDSHSISTSSMPTSSKHIEPVEDGESIAVRTGALEGKLNPSIDATHDDSEGGAIHTQADQHSHLHHSHPPHPHNPHLSVLRDRLPRPQSTPGLGIVAQEENGEDDLNEKRLSTHGLQSDSTERPLEGKVPLKRSYSRDEGLRNIHRIDVYPPTEESDVRKTLPIAGGRHAKEDVRSTLPVLSRMSAHLSGGTRQSMHSMEPAMGDVELDDVDHRYAEGYPRLSPNTLHPPLHGKESRFQSMDSLRDAIEPHGGGAGRHRAREEEEVEVEQTSGYNGLRSEHHNVQPFKRLSQHTDSGYSNGSMKDDVYSGEEDENTIFPENQGPFSKYMYIAQRSAKGFGKGFVEVFGKIVPRGGTLSSVFNLSSFVLGAGIISIPSAFNTSGLIVSIIYLLIVTSLTVYSIVLIAMAYEKTGYRSFESMAHGLFGPGYDVVVAALLFLLCFGSCVGFVVAVGDVVGPVLNFESAPPFLKSKEGRMLFQVIVWLVFMLPVSLPRHVNSLRYVSTAGVSFIMLFVVCLVVHSIRFGFTDGLRDDIALVRGGNRAISGLAIFMFAYLCQVNSFKVYEEMTNRSVRRMAKDTTIACGFCLTTYLITGFFGYAEFGSTLSGSILKYYDPHSSTIFLIVYCGIVIKLCASFSLNQLACRTALFQVVRWDVNTMPFWKHTVVAASFAFGSLAIGLLVPDINMVFGLVGAFCGGFIGFIFPALFIMYSGNWGLRQVGWWHYLATYTLLICGVIGVVFGTVTSVYSIVVPASSSGTESASGSSSASNSGSF